MIQVLHILAISDVKVGETKSAFDWLEKPSEKERVLQWTGQETFTKSFCLEKNIVSASL